MPANAKLLATMLQNIYFLPMLLGSRPALRDIWHSSNMQQRDYLDDVPQEFLPRLSEAERSWINEQLSRFRFRQVLERYLSTYQALQCEDNIAKRRDILRRWNEFWASSRGVEG